MNSDLHLVNLHKITVTDTADKIIKDKPKIIPNQQSSHSIFYISLHNSYSFLLFDITCKKTVFPVHFNNNLVIPNH